MGASSRRKGANGERDFRNLLRAFGFACDRDGTEHGDLRHDVPGVHFEVKRRETLALPQWIRQAEEDADARDVAVVAFRQSRQPWRVVVEAEEFLRLKVVEAASREVVLSADVGADCGQLCDEIISLREELRRAKATLGHVCAERDAWEKPRP
jgi:Holliday junction resolvase